MTGALFLIFIFYLLSLPILTSLSKKYAFVNMKLLQKLFFYHYVFWFVYYLYALYNPSDSWHYYNYTKEASNWMENYNTGTEFIHWVAYPFIKTGFNYEMMMALFAWLAYWGFVYFYIFFKEHIRSKIYWKGYDLVTILFFLPNMHFWTSSLGKGSIIFMGIGLFSYAMVMPQKRFFHLILGMAIVYHVRPHVFLFLVIGAVVGYIIGSAKVSFIQKFTIVVGFITIGVLLYGKILEFTSLNEQSFDEFSNKMAGRLSGSAGSGVNITNYPLYLKLFSFWFRPLFIDLLGGALGFIVSFENLFYLILTAKLCNRKFIPFLKNASSTVKMSLVIFLSASYVFSFVMANLGIAMRQKSAIMYFLLFIILSFMDYQKRYSK
jgi:hypothetical protein